MLKKIKVSRILSQNQLVRFTCTGKYPREYYTGKARKYIAETKNELEAQWEGPLLEGQLEIRIKVFDKFFNKKDGKIKKKDIDNFSKAILNCMTGIIYIDDSQIFKLILEKIHSEEIGMEIEVKKFGKN